MKRFESPIGWMARRRIRRIAAGVALLGLPGGFAWTELWRTTSAPKAAWGVVTFVLIGASLLASFAIYGYARDRATMSSALDERQRQLRDRAMVLAYQVLSTVVSLVVIAAGVAVLGFGRPIVLDANSVVLIVVSASVLIPLLPSAALAWIEPDALEEA